jgi:hypothetical protein
VAHAYEVHGPLGERLTDESARTVADRNEPWSVSYAMAAPPTPSSLQVRYDADTHALVVTSDRPLGPATIKMLDHHRIALATTHAIVKQGETRIPIRNRQVDGVFVQIGKFRGFAVADAYGEIHGQWGKPPPEQ